MTKTQRLEYEKWWCEEEINWIKQGGNSEFSLDYLDGFIHALNFSEKVAN